MVFHRGEGTLSVGVSVTAEGQVTPAPADSLGLPITNIYKITASALDGPGPYHYELSDTDGNVLVSGVGNELTNALLGLAIAMEAKETNNDDG
jgi:hypothetical protein